MILRVSLGSVIDWELTGEVWPQQEYHDGFKGVAAKAVKQVCSPQLPLSFIYLFTHLFICLCVYLFILVSAIENNVIVRHLYLSQNDDPIPQSTTPLTSNMS